MVGSNMCPALAAAGPADPSHRGVQPLVGNLGHDLLYVVFCAAAYSPPLRPVANLDQPVVMAEPDHGGDRELKHLRRGTTPDAAHHGEEVPVAKRVAEPVLAKKLTQGLL